TISKETAGILKGEYGATPAPVNAELQARALQGADPITCRPADLLEPEVDKQTEELAKIAIEKKIRLADDVIDDVLTYALFPQMGIRFLQNRDNPDAFEPPPDAAKAAAAAVPPSSVPTAASVYAVRVNGKMYTVEVAESGQLSDVRPAAVPVTTTSADVSGDAVKAVLAGNIFKVHVSVGDVVSQGDPLLVVEAMKMETLVVAPKAGSVTQVCVAEGDVVAVGDTLAAID
ncbi:MAG: biotin/lipoyl-binding protein, partial [Gammaproteobacteria bacterium]|nr:biotin/lipoyl-binding protein [Gammaproteobacteria bacterium]